MTVYRIAIAVIGVLFIAQGLLVKSACMPKGSLYRKRMLALEFARSKDEVAALAPNQRVTTKLNQQLLQDTSIVIPLYWALFVSLHAILFSKRFFQRSFVLVLLPVVISIAAVADLVENAAISSALNRLRGTENIYGAAIVKWIALAVACVLLGIELLNRTGSAELAGLAYFAAGVYLAVTTVKWPYEIDFGFAILGVATMLASEALRELSFSAHDP